MVPQALAAAGITDVGRYRVEEVGTDMVGKLEWTVAAEEVNITVAIFDAATRVASECRFGPLTIWPVEIGEIPV